MNAIEIIKPMSIDFAGDLIIVNFRINGGCVICFFDSKEHAWILGIMGELVLYL